MPPQPTATIIGYHGTEIDLIDQIKEENFERSTKPEWLGRGAYFFVEGVSFQGPEEDAISWANVCVKVFKKRYDRWAVMTADIKTDKMLDLTDAQQLKSFNRMRDAVYKRFNFHNRAKGGERKDHIIDVEILDVIRRQTEIFAAKSHFFFKFTLENQRHIGSRIPNVTVVCVYEPEQAIDKDTIKNRRSGFIR